MAVVIARENETHVVPAWVSDLESFRRWSHMDEFPVHAKVLYFDGDVFLEDSMERHLHALLQTAIAVSISRWSEEHLPGSVYIDNMRFMNLEADLSSEPDILFISDVSFETEDVVVEDGDDSLEIQGSPDVVVEVISPSSLYKDDQILRRKYWQAGVKEYWLADSRKKPSLSILKRNGKKYVAQSADAQGWIKSSVLQARCRLVTKPGPAGTTKVTLDMKSLR